MAACDETRARLQAGNQLGEYCNDSHETMMVAGEVVSRSEALECILNRFSGGLALCCETKIIQE